MNKVISLGMVSVRELYISFATIKSAIALIGFPFIRITLSSWMPPLSLCYRGVQEPIVSTGFPE